MHVTRRSRHGFTLVELLTVIAIITLLIGILVPAMSGSRDQARKVRSAGLLRAIETGCQSFQNENNTLPRSSGENPFEPASANVPLSGAQWLSLQMMGADQQGYIKPILSNDTGDNPDGKIDEKDWREWYSLNPKRTYSRSARYVEADSNSLLTAKKWTEQHQDRGAPTPAMRLGSSDWNNENLPFFVDAFNFPVLYYRANPTARTPFSLNQTGASFIPGRYDQSDNAPFTGSDGKHGAMARQFGATDGWDLTGNGVTTHPLGKLGYKENQQSFPDENTFARIFTDLGVFESTERNDNDKGKIWPYKPDRFILISAGKDGLYGTTDDVRNFESASN